MDRHSHQRRFSGGPHWWRPAFLGEGFFRRQGQPLAREDVRPLIEGGFRRGGALAAGGGEHILLTYTLPEPETIREIEFELVLSNDYLVEVTSNLQEPFFLPVAQAREM